MLREIINFTRSLAPETFHWNLKLREGLHINIILSSEGKLESPPQVMRYKKNDELNQFLQECMERQVHTEYVSANKMLDSDQKIHSCSPFSFI
jgi:hypothetical protein